MVAFVHNHNRIRAREGGYECGVVGALHIHRRARIALIGGEAGERGVLGVGTPAVLVLERVVGEYEDCELLAHGRGGKAPAPEAIFLVEHFHAPTEVAVERHTQEVLRVSHVLEGL